MLLVKPFASLGIMRLGCRLEKSAVTFATTSVSTQTNGEALLSVLGKMQDPKQSAQIQKHLVCKVPDHADYMRAMNKLNWSTTKGTLASLYQLEVCNPMIFVTEMWSLMVTWSITCVFVFFMLIYNICGSWLTLLGQLKHDHKVCSCNRLFSLKISMSRFLLAQSTLLWCPCDIAKHKKEMMNARDKKWSN